MAQPTQQDNAINAALALRDLMITFKSLLHLSQDLSDRFTANDYLTVLGAEPTAVWAADGTIGEADTTPNPQHPITADSLYLAANDITGGVYMLNDFISFMSNSAVSTSDRNATVAKLVR